MLTSVLCFIIRRCYSKELYRREFLIKTIVKDSGMYMHTTNLNAGSSIPYVVSFKHSLSIGLKVVLEKYMICHFTKLRCCYQLGFMVVRVDYNGGFHSRNKVSTLLCSTTPAA